MVPEFGQLALIIALLLSLCLSVIPMVGSFNGKLVWMGASRSLVAGLFVFIATAYGILTYSFFVDDFSVSYVANHSNLSLPMYYKVTAVWGGHEGSLLLWMLMLSGWTFAVSLFSNKLPIDMLARVLSVMGMVSVGFLAFTIFTSNPFDRILPNVPANGSDLNPLLQDPGFIFHPPMLYMGYVGFSVVFAFAIAALISGRVDSAWARWARPWTNLAWCFLTIGIALGSWWAYYELGWGGWWFWDPVENASFMPWLVGTALIHSLAMTEKRGVFKNWTLLLAIFAFSLSLLGTFLVRSGLLVSVHSFAADPTRGLFILAFIGVVVLGSLLLYAKRAPSVQSEAGFSYLSREAFLLANSIIFIISMGIVLLGTLFPLIREIMGLAPISVGEPFFNFSFVKLMAIVAVLIGIGSLLNFKNTQLGKVKWVLLAPAIISIWLGTFIPGVIDGPYKISAAIAIALGSWVILAMLFNAWSKTRNAANTWAGLRRLPHSYWGMVLAHIGFGFCILGTTLNTIYSDQRDVRLEVGETLVSAGYEYELSWVTPVEGPNYQSLMAEVVVRKQGKELARLNPEQRFYANGQPMTEAAIDAGFMRDIYVALGNQIDENAWAIRIHFKPLVRWIWLGAIFMALGGFVAIMDKRYKIKQRLDEKLASKTENESKETELAGQAEGGDGDAGEVTA